MGIEEIQKLRNKTGAGLLDCKKALKACQNDMQKAFEWLRKQGIAQAEKKSLRSAKEGRISSYIHGEGRIGVLVEVNVETDFASRGEDFKTFTHQLCLHIAAMNPLFIRREDVPSQVQKKEEVFFLEQAKKEGKKEALLDKITKGKVNKWLAEKCLMEQVFLPTSQGDSPKTVETVLKQLIARLGENISIRRFERFELGEDLC